MNIRKLKLALTVDLMNLPSSPDMIHRVQKVMNNFEEEAGKYLGLTNVFQSNIDEDFEKQTLALQYENCTLDINFFKNKATQNQYLHGFNIQSN